MKRRSKTARLIAFSIFGALLLFFQNCAQPVGITTTAGITVTQVPDGLPVIEPIPTSTPTTVPTVEPTTTPTSQPTVEPTTSPTSSPTTSPSPSPTPLTVTEKPISYSENNVCYDSNTSAPESGIEAELRYDVGEGNENNKSVDYFNAGNTKMIASNSKYYFQDIKVATHSCSLGFTTTDGKVLKDNNGNTLKKFFGLRMKTRFVLGPNDPEGYYQFATIADDGASIEYKKNGAGDTVYLITDNEGHHAPKMYCSATNKLVHMKKSDYLEMTYYYHQANPDQVSNTMLWSYAGPGSASSGGVVTSYQGSCGKDGDNTTGLLANGWKIPDRNNFLLPAGQLNPCSQNKTEVVKSISASSLSGRWAVDMELLQKAQMDYTLLGLTSDSKWQVVAKYKDSDAANVRQNLEFNKSSNYSQYRLDISFILEDKTYVQKSYNVFPKP